MRIDLHTHYMPRDCFGMTDREGNPCGPGVGRNEAGQEVLVIGKRSGEPSVAHLCDPERRLEDMDRTGVEMQVISILPAAISYRVNAEDGLRFCRRHNDAIAEVVRAYPDRFIGMATVPLQDINMATSELTRAVRELGFRAVEILSNVEGRNLDAKEFWPFYQAAQELDIPVYVHPGNVAGADRMPRYWLANLIGNPVETTIAIGSIIFGGVLESFPRLKFLFSHAGGCAPYIRGRWERGYEQVAECRSIPEPPSKYFSRLYFDTVTHFGPALAYLVSSVGADRVVLGSDYPHQMGDLDPVATVRNTPGITAADREKILGKTAAALLNLPA
ncbi:MAG: amidohydrolase family protein [Chloroflexota bacterium]